jgi:CheY-like chemotaxis protein
MQPNVNEDRLSVLVVDDNESIRESLVILLSHKGHRCESATNGIEALQKVKQSNFDIVLTDLQMPEMDGVALTRELHQLFPNLPVMIMTGQSDDTLLESAISAGAKAFLSKPFGVSELVMRLQTVLHVQEIA